MHYNIGTRGSKLALAQTNWVKAVLEEKYPEDSFSITIIKTKGDQIQNIALDKIGDKGLFVKEIETQLLKGKIDLAVHSMKDMPSTQVEGLVFSDAWKCEEANDVLILREAKSLNELKKNAIIGTGSKRRAYQMKKLRNDITCVSIRGNVETRIKKMNEEQLDGIIMAQAGLNRLGLEDMITHVFTYDEMVPACAQGILAIQCRENDHELLNKINACSNEEAKLRCEFERAFLSAMDGSCHVPTGAYLEKMKDELIFHCVHGDEDGKNIKQLHLKGTLDHKEKLLNDAIQWMKGKE